MAKEIRLNQKFFLQNSLKVARDLIGKKIEFNIDGVRASGIITETEAYFGDDPASHGFRGKTPRNEPMFCQGGITYIYFIYGMYFCLNFVTEKEGYPSAILIRGIELNEPEKKHLNGPGKICKYLGLNKNHNKLHLCQIQEIQLFDIGFSPKIKATPRIGISKNIEKEWRFVMIN